MCFERFPWNLINFLLFSRQITRNLISKWCILQSVIVIRRINFPLTLIELFDCSTKLPSLRNEIRAFSSIFQLLSRSFGMDGKEKLSVISNPFNDWRILPRGREWWRVVSTSNVRLAAGNGLIGDCALIEDYCSWGLIKLFLSLVLTTVNFLLKLLQRWWKEA